jgi:2-polyprenyl-6-methoxyphenol hydroxylase-like FAD-dependent oxidoreductase
VESILRDDVYFLEPLRRWRDGRIVLLVDAAHATTPGVGQGAAQALEDAVVLASEISDGANWPAALIRYEATRRPRAALALKLLRRADGAAQLGVPLGAGSGTHSRGASRHAFNAVSWRHWFITICDEQLADRTATTSCPELWSGARALPPLGEQQSRPSSRI